MLDDLLQTIETLKTRIERHRAYFSEGKAEARTRTALIDPMLCALGWDVSNPSAVEIEPRTDEGWADYALLGSNGKPVIFVEAKKLSENVKSHAKQSVNYAVGENLNRSPKIQYCALTNGDVWQVFDVLSQDLILETSVSSPDLAKSALKFLGLWRSSLQDGGFDSAVEPLVEIEDDVGPEPPPPPRIGWTPLSQIPVPTHQPAPKAIRFADGERTLTTWRGVLAQTGLWLYREGVLTQENCEVVRRGKQVLFSLSGLHPGGDPFRSPVYLEDTGIIMEGSLSARAWVRLARKVLEHFGRDPSQVTLKLQ